MSYVAVRQLRMPDGSIREPGDEVPEAATWAHIASWVPHHITPAASPSRRRLIAARDIRHPGGVVAAGDVLPMDLGSDRERDLWLRYHWALEAPAEVDAPAPDPAPMTKGRKRGRRAS